jgi:hypothetical protein
VESTDLVAQSVGNDGEDGMNEEVVVAERWQGEVVVVVVLIYVQGGPVKLAARDLPKDTKDPVKSIKTIPSSGETCPTPGITAKRYVAAWRF